MTGFAMLLPSPAPPAVGGRWATVTQASPLRVKLDGETTALAVTPDTLVAGLVADDRVWVQVYRRRLVVLGKAGGAVEQTYTPALTASTSDPDLGTSPTQAGRYFIDPVTRIVTADIRITFGTDSDPGSGTYRISLPTSVDFNSGSTAFGTGDIIGWGAIRDVSSVVANSRQVTAYLNQGGPGRIELGVADGTSVLVTNSGPFVWADGDSMSLKCIYRAA